MPQDPNTSPIPRSYASMANDGSGHIVLFGGSDSTNNKLDDTWIWDGSISTKPVLGISPSKRESALMANTGSGKILLFGGNSSDIYLNDTWIWDGLQWNTVSSDQSPSPRFGASMANDGSGHVILFGGMDASSYERLNDTWRWNGSQWAIVSTDQSPSTRYGATMANDGSGHVVLFGGRADMQLSDTWIWNGSTWENITTTTKPEARFMASMSYAGSGTVILFSGMEQTGMTLQDTWIWDGSVWNKQNNVGSPKAYTNPLPIAYDDSGHVVLFGNGYGTYAWIWDGSSWTVFNVPAAPTEVSAVATGSTTATVSWKASANNGSAITGYKVISDRGGITVTSATSSSETVTGLTKGAAYTFFVMATNGIGTSATSVASNSVKTWNAPAAPTGVTAVVTGGTTATVSWVAPENNGSAITSYTVTSRPGGGTATSATSPVKIVGLTKGAAYTFTVTATNGIGTSDISVASNSVKTWNVPAAPTGVTAIPRKGSATVSWKAPANNGSAITKYTVTSKPGGKTATSVKSPVIVKGLTKGTSYTFTVKATNAIGTSAASSASKPVKPT